jgi:hypothetical protein
MKNASKKFRVEQEEKRNSEQYVINSIGGGTTNKLSDGQESASGMEAGFSQNV